MNRTTSILIGILVFLSIPLSALAIENSFAVFPTHRNAIKASSIVAEIKPGDTYEDTFTVRNESLIPLTLGIYAADGKKTNKDNSTIETRTEEKNNIGAWTISSQNEVTLNPDESIEIPFTITIPEETELGDYQGGITAQLDTNELENNIIPSYRVVVPIIVKVTDDPQPIPMLTIIEDTQPWNFFPYILFFIGALIFFIASMIYLIHQNKKDKKNVLKKRSIQ